MSAWVANAVAFLLGAVVVVTGWTFFGDSITEPLRANHKQAFTGDSSAAPYAPRKETSVVPQAESAALDEARRGLVFLPRPGESPKEEFQRLFREMLHGPIEERDDRLSLLLARLQSHGRDAVPVIREYLRSGRDVPRAELYHQKSHLRLIGNFGSFRDLLFSTLAQVMAGDPELVTETSKAVLEDTRTLKEALAILAIAEKHDLEGIREEVIVAITRLAGEKKGFEFSKAVDLMTRLKSEELVPVIASVIEAKPYSLDVESFLGALWSFPGAMRVEYSKRLEALAVKNPKGGLHELFGALWSLPVEVRRETTERILAEDSLRSALGGGHTLHKLDFRIPQVRELALEWFGSSAAATEKAETVDHLGSTKGWGPNVAFNSDGSPVAVPGAPGTRAQAEARLALLEEVASICPEPLIQQKLAKARANLVKQTQGSTK